MSNLEKIIRILTDNEVRIKDIYEAVEMERMDFYNMRRSKGSKKKEEVAQLLSEKFAHIIQKTSTQTEATSDLQQEYIQTLKRENELLRQLNERDLFEIKERLSQLEKNFRT